MIEIIELDLGLAPHAQALVELMSGYACDPMGGGQDLSPDVKASLPQRLRARADYYAVLALSGDRPVGLINCFEGFSTFQAKPLLNIHDVFVIDAWRGQGVARDMLRRVEQEARVRGCCKLTLEVLEGNASAQVAYRKWGFAPYGLEPAMGQALFWEKKLPVPAAANSPSA